MKVGKATEVRRGTKVENGGGATNKPPKAGQVMDSAADLMGKKAVFKTKLPHLAGGGADQIELQLKGNTAVTW
jgi:hypothetical protein